ncbi:MAG TPA: hypothetical protein VEK15_24680, partial [Vicinamibacteria bacterium]|nr:hypothetical protein [Vicinamibacteria bacterium]
ESRGLQAASFRAPGADQNSSGGFTALGRDPNDLINAEGNLPNDRTHMFRVLGSTEIPKVGIYLGASYQHLTGTPWAAKALVRLPQGPRAVNIEPRGARRMPSEEILDLRLSKPFSLGNGRRIEILFDLLNALNDVSPQRVANTNYYAENFGEGRDFLTPRRLMVGVKASF